MPGWYGAGIQQVTSDERWFNEIRLGRAFACGGQQAGVAAQLSEVQLFNPAGSGVNAILRVASGSGAVNTTLSFRTYNTALATLVTAGINLLAGGAAGQCVVRKTTVAAFNGTEVFALPVTANIMTDVTPAWFFEIGPGEGVLIGNNIVNELLSCSFMWIELPI